MHSIEIIWKEWEYQLERSKEFTVLLTSIAAGILLFATSSNTNSFTTSFFGILGSASGLLISLFWLRLNRRWARIIQRDTTELTEIFKDDALASFHIYTHDSWNEYRNKSMTGSFWWLKGTMGLPLLYVGYFISSLVYFILYTINCYGV